MDARNIQLILEMLLASLSCSTFPLVIRKCRYEVVVNAVCVPVPCVLVGALCTGGIPHMSAHIVYAVVRPNAFCIGRGLVPQRYALIIFHEFFFLSLFECSSLTFLCLWFLCFGSLGFKLQTKLPNKEKQLPKKEGERERERRTETVTETQREAVDHGNGSAPGGAVVAHEVRQCCRSSPCRQVYGRASFLLLFHFL